MTAATRDPQRAGLIADRLGAILAARGINPLGIPAEPSAAPVTALELAEARIPPRYRNAVANHPEVLAWTRTSPNAADVAPVDRRASLTARRS